ncbi:MAG TPA: nuclear transport factor 2 family protein [Anaerolineae bacterium]|nr:nuclear transport factor 2 family protein [Anaerolineae bacterium]HOQ98952.1 nuclear transport factor 2 family protein [Anaerolineae bacterium]HPL30026.1 nuclear transport factor 2 family protein [Anaerolineae bacterium]
MQLPDTVSIVKSFVDAVNRHETDEVLRMLDESAILSFEPPLPRSPKQVYNGRGEIEKWLGELMAEHLNITARDWQASGNEVNWNARLVSDRFEEMGIDPLQAQVRTVLDGSLIRSIAFKLTPESVKKVQSVTAAQPS